jgi:exodeoxyribonuclease-5
MTEEQFAVEILAALPYEPNPQQMQVARALARFCARGNNDSEDRVFVLNGYAGTGKTSLTAALVRALPRVGIQPVLLAPTGRAAKVFSFHSGRAAYTIHRRIYKHSTGALSGSPRENKAENTIFIVDEASMIGGDADQGNVLTDLIHYVYSGINCRLILLGDTAQLPPVGSDISPAMDPDTLRSYGLKVSRATLTEVARQGAMSGILFNAGRLRRACRMTTEHTEIMPLRSGLADVTTVDGNDLTDMIDSCYRRDGVGETIVITRSNMLASEFNRGIRSVVLDHDEELARGDLMIAVKNNYFWTKSIKGLEFIANGDILELQRVVSSEVKYGLRFADVVFTLPERPGLEFTAKIVLECLSGSAAALGRDALAKLYYGCCNDTNLHAPSDPMEIRTKRLSESPYWNALQVKYAYAVTCHKAQGGQWKNVFIDLSYIPPEQTGAEFYRWLYTAVTRAREQLYLINPPEALIE